VALSKDFNKENGLRKNILGGLCIFLISICFLINFVGCSKRAQDPNTIVIWHWMTDRDQAFQDLALQYEQETGIKIIFELYAPSDIYSKKIIASAQARILPDIYGILNKKKIFSEFIKSGFVADLTGDFAAHESVWEKSLFSKALTATRFQEGNSYGIDAGIYGVPIDVTNIQMLFNKELLEKAGITKIPVTFDEFLAVTKALKLVGISGFVSGWGELWMVECFASNYAFNIMGEDKVMATYRGEVPYTDPDWLAVFGVFEKLRDNNALAEGIVTKVNKYAEQDFALGRAAFAFNGSWSVNVYHDMNPDLKYGVMLPPAINSKRPMQIWGGAGSSFIVNNTSLNKNKAIAFLKWITDKDQQIFLSESTKNLPANRYALGSIPRELSEFAKAMDHTTHPTGWPLNEDAVVVEIFDKGLQSIMIGEKTPLQVAEEVQKVKERQLAKKKRN